MISCKEYFEIEKESVKNRLKNMGLFYTPRLDIFQVGSNPASDVYIANKMKYPEAQNMYACSWFIKDNKGNDELKEAMFPDYLLNKV